MLRQIFRLETNLTRDNLIFASQIIDKYDLRLVEEETVIKAVHAIIEDSMGDTEMKIRVQKYLDKRFAKKWEPKEDLYLQYEDYERLINVYNNRHINFGMYQVLFASDTPSGYIGTCGNVNYYIS